MRLLLIEDSQDLAIEIADFFESRGNTIDSANDGITGLHLASVNDYDLIILDLMLPGIDGIDLCRRLRDDADIWTPVIMLTARDTLKDKLAGLESGADDYLVKPFSLKELQLRIDAILRRVKGNSKLKVLKVSDLELNRNTFDVTVTGTALTLTPIEFKILEILMINSPGVVRRRDLEYYIWGDVPPDGDALRVHIHNLRSSIEKHTDSKKIITVRGIGYKLIENDQTHT
ncbi:MAG: response regulator transcription factor [Gammaproteobacteria bacterium]|nr:MAG: response regulator transcription factor [Gammaproteobacteria bacterium]